MKMLRDIAENADHIIEAADCVKREILDLQNGKTDTLQTLQKLRERVRDIELCADWTVNKICEIEGKVYNGGGITR